MTLPSSSSSGWPPPVLRAGRVVLALTAVLVAASAARAEVAQPQASAIEVHPTARLLYERAADANGCPDEAGLRDMVAARLGYDPFQPDAAASVTADIAKSGHGLRAHVELRDATGKLTGSRRLSSHKDDCNELASAMALAISIAIDPLRLTRPTPPPVVAPPPPVACPTCPACPTPICPAPAPCRSCPPPAPRPPPGPEYRLSAGALVAINAEPGVAVGGEVELGIRWRRVSLSIAGRFDGMGGIDLPGSASGRVRAQVLAGGLVGCVHHYILAVCALAMSGALVGEATNISMSTGKHPTPWAALGGRVALELPLSHPRWAASIRRPTLALRVHGDLLGRLIDTTLTVDSGAGLPANVWHTPPLSGAVGLDLGVYFQ